MNAHTQGPWGWFIGHDGISIRTPDRGQLIVLDVSPRGRSIRLATRTDNLGGLLHPANYFAKTETPVRAGFYAIDNPDGHLIVSSPDLLAALMSGTRHSSGCYHIDAATVESAIAKATGATP